MIASESGTTIDPWCSTGSLPVGETLRRRLRSLSSLSAMVCSSNGTPLWVSASQPRIDQEEMFFSPT